MGWSDLCGMEQSGNALLYVRPLGYEDGVTGGIAGGEIRCHTMCAQDTFRLAADAFHGGAGAEIANIRMQADAEHVPCLEGVGKHEQLSFSVGPGTRGSATVPGVADFAGVRK